MPRQSKKFSNNIPLRIRSLRIKFDLTQKQLADKLHKSESAVRMWELGKSEPDSESINCMSEFFNITTDYLLGLPYTITRPKDRWHWSECQDYNNADEYEKEYLMYKYGRGHFETHDNTGTLTDIDNNYDMTLDDREKTLINTFRRAGEEGKQRIIQSVLNISDETALYKYSKIAAEGGEINKSAKKKPKTTL